jgi:diadenosine tetraphosphate (Ap4A) HIT family hydrolase
MEDCIFCKIVQGNIPCHKVWESTTHLAFLSIFPNIKGFTVVIPKKHMPSKVTLLPTADYTALFNAAKEVSLLLDKTLGVERTALIAEGMGINHAHIKLFPLIGTQAGKPWTPIHSSAHKRPSFEKYEGFIASNDSDRADDTELAELAAQIRKGDTT